MRTILFFSVAIGTTACSGSVVEVGQYNPKGAADGGSAIPTLPDGAVSPTRSKVEIHLVASTAAFAHTDGLAAQTPSDQKIGIRSLKLLTSENDPAPLLVFDHGSAAVEAGLNDKDDTVVATVAAAGLKAATYTLARVGISHVRYRVAATMHGLGQSVPGTFDNLQVLSRGSVVDGQSWNKGHYRFTFEVNGQPIATQPGEGGPLPEAPSAGGIRMDTSGAETAYVFPVRIPLDPSVASDVKMIFEINTHDNLRWQDEAAAGNKPNVFDVTPSSFEPVKSFGANSFRIVADFSSSAL